MAPPSHVDVTRALHLAEVVRLEAEGAATRAQREAMAREALTLYRQALSLDPDRIETLVHAATVSLALGERAAEAHQMAERILELTKDVLTKDVASGFSRTRHRAGALAILGRVDEAARAYESLSRLDDSTTALADARFDASRIAAAIGQPRDLFKPAFPPLELFVFAGHLPDRPGDPERFPPDAVAVVRDAIAKELNERRARVGFASAAAGADLLFIEALSARHGSAVHLVLPWSREEFRRTSVAPYEPGGAPVWAPLFDRALERAASVREIGQVFEPGGDAGWQYANEVTAGIALLIARASRLDLRPMVLWDGHPSRGEGGTGAFHQLWQRQLHADPIVISPPAARKPDPPMAVKRTERPILHQVVKSVLFADIVGYSRLTERAMPEFIQTFLDRVSALVASSRHAPCYVNTWGDALFAVFDFTRDAGLFALELTKFVEENRDDWLRRGLYWEERVEAGEPAKHALTFRIGLHAGPVVMHHEPITRRVSFTGAHVTRAARIEPIAGPGEVYASEEFAALAELDAAMRRTADDRGEPAATRAFVCHSAGTMPLAKDYPGLHHVYRVVPMTVLELEELAKAIHEQYCDERRAKGETPEQNGALVPWDELPEDLRDANRAQAADIPHKLRTLGWEVTAGPGEPSSAIAITDPQIDALAIREHDRWMAERHRQGWTYATVRDNARRHHPMLVPWSELSESERDKDRATVRMLPRLIELAKLRVRRT